MGRFVRERAPRKEREVVDFEAEAILAFDAGEAEAKRLEKQGSSKFAKDARDRARKTCIILFEGAMEAGQPGVAEIVAWYANLGSALRTKADAKNRALDPRLVTCGR